MQSGRLTLRLRRHTVGTVCPRFKSFAGYSSWGHYSVGHGSGETRRASLPPKVSLLPLLLFMMFRHLPAGAASLLKMEDITRDISLPPPPPLLPPRSGILMIYFPGSNFDRNYKECFFIYLNSFARSKQFSDSQEVQMQRSDC